MSRGQEHRLARIIEVPYTVWNSILIHTPPSKTPRDWFCEMIIKSTQVPVRHLRWDKHYEFTRLKVRGKQLWLTVEATKAVNEYAALTGRPYVQVSQVMYWTGLTVQAGRIIKETMEQSEKTAIKKKKKKGAPHKTVTEDK